MMTHTGPVQSIIRLYGERGNMISQSHSHFVWVLAFFLIFLSEITVALPSCTENITTINPIALTQTNLTAGDYAFALSEPSELFRLSKRMASSGDSGIGMARSYDGYDWEVLPGSESVLFSCNQCEDISSSLVCLVSLPELEEVGAYYQIESIDTTPTVMSLENCSLAATLLTQATFGPTRDSVSDFLENHNGNVSSWITNQMQNVPMQLHREYYRKRGNTRVDVATDIGGVLGPCESNSRWHRFALTEEDIDKTVTVKKISSPTSNGIMYTFSIDNLIRTEVSINDYNATELGYSFLICNVEEVLGGVVTIGDNCDDTESLSNIAIEMSHASTLSQISDLLLINNTDYSNLTKIINVDDVYVFKGNGAHDMSQCDLPTTIPYFAKTAFGFLKYDPRLILLENTLENPIDFETSSEQECPSVSKTFLNIDSCITNRQTCSPILYSSANFVLNETMIRDWYTLGGKYVYYVSGLRPDEDDTPTPCDGTTSRWVNRKNTSDTHTSDCNSTAYSMLSSNRNAIVSALESALNSDDYAQMEREKRVLEVTISCDDDNDELIGTKVLLSNGECWEHAHPDEFSVYDFSFWTRAHPGGPSPVEQFAIDESAQLTFPYWHTMSRWTTGEDSLTFIGNLGDVVDFADLETTVQQKDVAALVNAIGARSSEGFEVCGSPGEVSNDPALGNLYKLDLGDDTSVHQTIDQDKSPPIRQQKQVVWASVSLKAEDQLRQRVAWALSQIFVISEEGVSKPRIVEVYTNYYDIFVRNAFTNYRDVLREVSYSPMMARMLTYLNSKSFASTGQYPDENYAREFMQLFTVGLYELNMDGSRVTDEDGNYVDTYDNNDVLSFAAGWTGYKMQANRGNVEYINFGNILDPMAIESSWRDYFPKKDINDGFIGDAYPLCGSRPTTQFLRKGAVYRYRGQNPLPELMEEGSEFGDDNDKTIERFNLNGSTSSLFGYLCNRSIGAYLNGEHVDGEELECNFKSQVTLVENLDCDGMECDVDTVRMVRMNYTNNGTSVPVYYEYVPPACVSFPFYANGSTISKSGGTRWQSSPRCADKTALDAAVVCCASDTNPVANQMPDCRYANERLTYARAEERCDGIGKSMCNFVRARAENCFKDQGYLWSTRNCSTNIQINSDGLVSIVHDTDIPEWDSMVPLDSGNYFQVSWIGDDFPLVDSDNATCPDDCVAVGGDSCYCTTDIITSAVFTTTLPQSVSEITSRLHVGAFDPATYDNGTFTLCSTLSNKNITVYFPSPISCASSLDNIQLSMDTVFEIKDQVGKSQFYKNLESVVQVGSRGKFEFRNPPMMISMLEPTVRDTQYEIEAIIDHFLNHKNTPPFVAYRMIQRLVTSNPSPRYIKVVATAFKTGRYENYGTGQRGDLAATVAAVLLDREARSPTLYHDPSFGVLREPLLKVLHLLRAMEFKPAKRHSEIDLRNVDFGEYPYTSPSIFNFFSPEYQPPGPISEANLVSPESQLLTAPYIVSFINGAISLIMLGLNECYQGYGEVNFISCSDARSKPFDYFAGNLSYIPTNFLTASTREVVSELDMLLTGGRLNNKGYALIEEAFDTKLDGEGEAYDGVFDGLQAAQKLFVMTPEFHTTGANTFSEEVRDTSISDNDSSGTSEPYKAIVYVYLSGAIDSFNVLVPYSDCNGTDMYQQYVEVRENVALSLSDLLPIDVLNNTQPCDVFGIHHSLSVVQEMYNEGDALFVSNIGPLVEPITKEEYNSETKEYPPSLFSHNVQTLATQTLYAQETSTSRGVIGRTMDALTSIGFKTASYSIFGNTRTLDPETSNNYDVIDRRRGVTRLDSSDTSPGAIELAVNLTSHVSKSHFAETWASQLRVTKTRTDLIADALDAVDSLEQNFAAGTTSIGTQLEQVATLIKANKQTLHNDRDAFYVELGGFDTHADLTETLETLLIQLNEALTSFVEEMKLQGMWGNVTVMVASEFGRTLTSNGLGTDHGWGGNMFMFGGAVKGGQILGSYPTDLTDEGELNLGRGRLIPTTPWESVWNAVAGWFGVSADDTTMNTVLPNLANFDDVFSCSDVFADASECAIYPTSIPTLSPAYAPQAPPTVSPSSAPQPSPTVIPQPSPTFEATLTPTSIPQPLPSPIPTLVPTKADTVSVEVSFDLTSSNIPTSTDESLLLSNIISNLDVDASTVKGFTVSYSPISSSSRKMRRYLLSDSYLWTTSFNVVVSLSSTSVSSGVELVSALSTLLTTSNFTEAVYTATGATVDTSTVSGSLTTKSPTLLPSLFVSPSPTMMNNDNYDKGSGSSSNNIFTAATLGGAACGVVLLGVGVAWLYRSKTSSDKVDKIEGNMDGEQYEKGDTEKEVEMVFANAPTQKGSSLLNGLSNSSTSINL